MEEIRPSISPSFTRQGHGLFSTCPLTLNKEETKKVNPNKKYHHWMYSRQIFKQNMQDRKERNWSIKELFQRKSVISIVLLRRKFINGKQPPKQRLQNYFWKIWQHHQRIGVRWRPLTERDKIAYLITGLQKIWPGYNRNWIQYGIPRQHTKTVFLAS